MDSVAFTDGGACEEFLLKFIEECQSVIAEILRLVDFLPTDFLNPEKSKFKALLLDFKYFSKTPVYEKELSYLEDLQDQFYSCFGDILSRFQLLFQTIANLLQSFVAYTKEVAAENVVVFVDFTRELEAEALCAVSSVVLHVDRLLDGCCRERLFVAIYRNSEDRNQVDFLVDFLRQEIENYERLFTGEFMYQRVKIAPKYVENCLEFFERVVRDRREAGLRRISKCIPETLFGCLIFASKVRNEDHARMKFFVDYFFRDQWVISISLGLSVSVADEWFCSPAAKAAIQSQLNLAHIRELGRVHHKSVMKMDFANDDIKPESFEMYIDSLVRFNASLKWMILHTDKKYERVGTDYSSKIDVSGKFQLEVVDVVLKVAAFEAEIMKVYSKYVRERNIVLGTLRTEICGIIGEFAEIFSNGFPSLKLEKREKLGNWLILIKKTLEEMDLQNVSNSAAVQQIKRRFVQVEEMLDLGGNMAMAHFLEKLHNKLDSFSSGLATSEDGERRIESVADAPYLWPLISDWIPRIQSRLLQSYRSQPVRVLFQKLAISISKVCGKLQNEDKKRLIGRAYSGFLERRLRSVLQSVPNHLFTILHSDVIPCLNFQWNPVIEKSKVKEMSNFEENCKLSSVTYKISNMSLGISHFSLRQLGTIEVNSKELLECGIRQELKNELPKLFLLSEKEAKSNDMDLESLLGRMIFTTSRFHNAFIYMCDHIGVSGNELWREEISTYMEVATGLLDSNITKKIVGPQSSFGILYKLLMKATDPRANNFMSTDCIWRERKSGKVTFSSKVADMIEKWIPCFAISTLDAKLVSEIDSLNQDILLILRNLTASFSVDALNESFFVSKEFDQLIKTVTNHQTALVDCIAKIGQIVFVRAVLTQAIHMNGRVRTASLFSAVDAANKHILSDYNNLPAAVSSVVSIARICGCFVPFKTMLKLTSHQPSNTSLVLLILLSVTLSRINGSRKDHTCGQSIMMGLAYFLMNTNQQANFEETYETMADCSLSQKNIKFIDVKYFEAIKQL